MEDRSNDEKEPVNKPEPAGEIGRRITSPVTRLSSLAGSQSFVSNKL